MSLSQINLNVTLSDAKSTSSRRTRIGEIRLSSESASCGLPLEGGTIPSELLGAESHPLPVILLLHSIRLLEDGDVASSVKVSRVIAPLGCIMATKPVVFQFSRAVFQHSVLGCSCCLACCGCFFLSSISLSFL